jgi:hypothetical protein
VCALLGWEARGRSTVGYGVRGYLVPICEPAVVTRSDGPCFCWLGTSSRRLLIRFSSDSTLLKFVEHVSSGTRRIQWNSSGSRMTGCTAPTSRSGVGRPGYSPGRANGQLLLSYGVSRLINGPGCGRTGKCIARIELPGNRSGYLRVGTLIYTSDAGLFRTYSFRKESIRMTEGTSTIGPQRGPM